MKGTLKPCIAAGVCVCVCDMRVHPGGDGAQRLGLGMAAPICSPSQYHSYLGQTK